MTTAEIIMLINAIVWYIIGVCSAYAYDEKFSKGATHHFTNIVIGGILGIMMYAIYVMMKDINQEDKE